MEGKFGAFVIPAKDGGVAPSFLGGSHLGIFEGTENEDLSWDSEARARAVPGEGC